jgi:hypothetical protein
VVIKKYIMGMLNKDRFPYVYELKCLGGVNTEEGDLYAKKYGEKIENEYRIMMKLFQLRSELGGNKEIHYGTER